MAAAAFAFFFTGGKAGCRRGHGPFAPIVAERINRRHIVFGIAAFTFTMMRFAARMGAIRFRINRPFALPIVTERVNISGFGRTAAAAGAGILTNAKTGRLSCAHPIAPIVTKRIDRRDVCLFRQAAQAMMRLAARSQTAWLNVDCPLFAPVVAKRIDVSRFFLAAVVVTKTKVGFLLIAARCAGLCLDAVGLAGCNRIDDRVAIGTGNRSTVLVTAVHTLKRVSAVVIVLNRAGIAVLQLRNHSVELFNLRRACRIVIIVSTAGAIPVFDITGSLTGGFFPRSSLQIGVIRGVDWEDVALCCMADRAFIWLCARCSTGCWSF